MTTGRTIWHFHTRTKTGRAPELQEQAPDVWVEVNELDAREWGVADGDVVRLTSHKGCIEAPVRLGGSRRVAMAQKSMQRPPRSQSP